MAQTLTEHTFQSNFPPLFVVHTFGNAVVVPEIKLRKVVVKALRATAMIDTLRTANV